MFANFLGVIEAIARLEANATVGNIQKMNLHLTRGQVERALKNLMTEEYVTFEMMPYGKTGKKVWACSNRCVTNMCIVANAVCEVAK